MSHSCLVCRAVLFDWDGTLLDSYAAGADCFERVFTELGVPFSPEKFSTAYSPDWYQTYWAFGLEEGRWPEADRLWRKFYAEHTPALVFGAAGMLDQLRAKGLALGIITTGHRSRVAGELARLGLSDVFQVVICGDDCANVKPHPEGIERALATVAFSAEQAVFVGDSPEDMAMARNAGVRFIGVPSPYPTNRLLASAGAMVVGSLAALTEVLTRV